MPRAIPPQSHPSPRHRSPRSWHGRPAHAFPFILHPSSFILLFLLSGCASHQGPPLPTYPNLPTPDAINLLSARSHATHTVTAEGLLTLTRPDGQSVRLDTALVMSPPTKVRVRAWKFGQAVFDLTINDTGVFLVSPDNSSRAQQIKSAGVSAAQLARTWSLLNGGFFDSPDLSVTTHENILEIRRPLDHQTVICQVDRPTLTPRRYTLLDPSNQPRFSLTLSDYSLVNNIPWPHRLKATSDSGTILITLRSVEINTDIPPTAFTPPRRAEKLP